MIEPRKLLEQASFFRDLSPASKDAIAGICGIRQIRKKEVLFREGEQGRSVFLLATGNIRLSRAAADGREMVIKIIQPGEFFAEVILFEQDRYPVAATATSPATVLVMPRLQIHDLLANREFRNDFIAMLMKKQRYLADRLFILSTGALEGRLVRFLAEHCGRKERIAVSFSKKEIAGAIGATPEALSRLIKRLKRRRLLAWTGRELRLHPAFWKLDNSPG